MVTLLTCKKWNITSQRVLTLDLVYGISIIEKDKLRLHLAQYNIESRFLWKPMHLQPLYKQYKFYNNNSSEKLFNLGLCLPSGTTLTEGQISKISQIIISSK